MQEDSGANFANATLSLKVIDGLFRSANQSEQRLGIKLLAATLKTDFFSSSYEFEFSARSRGYGLYPHTEQELQDWFTRCLQFTEPFITLDSSVGNDVRTVIVRAFRGLMVWGGQIDTLTRLAHSVVEARGFWPEGWAALRETRMLNGKTLVPNSLADLGALEDFLRPRNTTEMVRSVVLKEGGIYDDIDDLDDIESGLTRAIDRESAIIARLAEEVAADATAWQSLLPELVASRSPKAGRFGEHLAQATQTPRALWTTLVTRTAATSEPGISILCGFLSGVQKNDASLAREILDEALEDPVLGPWLPTLQIGTLLDTEALARLHRSLDSGMAPVERYFGLAYGSVVDAIAEPELKRLLCRIAEIEGGHAVARRVLVMRYFGDRSAERVIGDDLIETGRMLLTGIRFSRATENLSREDYDLALLARIALVGEGGRSIVQALGRSLASAISRYEIHRYDYDDLVQALFEVHPTEMLDTLFAGDEISRRRSAEFLGELPRAGKAPLSETPDDVVLAWCGREPSVR
ncbi:hypothetical protein [Methylobacterium sp. WL9]|uniref:hypothetical protein n=1 Tax=Methylobacterium sp. WL9 TaxID=2603898 RepID=UPI0011C6F07C|nr:hypothetical protein [Methylobacterium sp. WL9]TXN21727.1 hypothetical protein FV217_13455 [Methylobacterium sp. WL9]